MKENIVNGIKINYFEPSFMTFEHSGKKFSLRQSASLFPPLRVIFPYKWPFFKGIFSEKVRKLSKTEKLIWEVVLFWKEGIMGLQITSLWVCFDTFCAFVHPPAIVTTLFEKGVRPCFGVKKAEKKKNCVFL